ncbi:3-dehydroquinate synthase [bacterium]|nr:3-dehydroquinate synthase [bacterium]
MKSQIVYSKALPKPAQFSTETVLFYDSILAKNKSLKSWINSFPYKIALESGEKLKTLNSFESVLNKISKLKVPKTTQLTFVALGGGSVGDFTGFIASVYLRGRKLILLPSTWLSAVDSSHGGKTGLNLLNSKNQIGSFYPASTIYICDELLLTQPKARLTESMGEIIKIAVLSDAKLFKNIEDKINGLKQQDILKILPRVIDLKYKIVQRDPQEKNGIRRLLNLGHTMGHVFESNYGWPHGVCVLLGMQFAARWSFAQGSLPQKDFFRISMLIDSLDLSVSISEALQKISTAKISTLLSKDKKLTAHSQLDFIFIKKIGSCYRQSVTLQDVLNEVKRQKSEY